MGMGKPGDFRGKGGAGRETAGRALGWEGSSPRYRSTASRGFRTACFSTSGLWAASGSRAVPVGAVGVRGPGQSSSSRPAGISSPQRP